MKPRAPKKIIKIIRDQISLAKMENSNFGKDDALVKDRTELWRKKWVIPDLEKLLAWAEGRS
jgi:hypothetical protein